MFSREEKMYFIQRLFINHINEIGGLQYQLNMEILIMFKHLDYITKELYEELIPFIYEGAYDDSFYAISKVQELLCKEFDIPIRE